MHGKWQLMCSMSYSLWCRGLQPKQLCNNYIFRAPVKSMWTLWFSLFHLPRHTPCVMCNYLCFGITIWLSLWLRVTEMQDGSLLNVFVLCCTWNMEAIAVALSQRTLNTLRQSFKWNNKRKSTTILKIKRMNFKPENIYAFLSITYTTIRWNFHRERLASNTYSACFRAMEFSAHNVLWIYFSFRNGSGFPLFRSLSCVLSCELSDAFELVQCRCVVYSLSL